MTSAKRYFLAACLLIIFAQTLAGCAFLLSLDQEPRERVMPSDSNAVIVGIHVSSSQHVFPQTARRIFFVKFEDGSSDDILQGQILPDTHFRFGYAFLPNAKPGRYAAIGCTFIRSHSTYSNEYPVLFDRALVTRLTRTVAPGTVALLGNIEVSEIFHAQEEEYDDVQKHYFRKLTGKDIRTALKEANRGFFTLQGTWEGKPGRFIQEYPLDSASRQFLNMLLQGLPAAWQPWFEKSRGPGP